MSYIIHVWEHPVPTTAEQADAILDDLFKRSAANPCRKLDDLLELLWDRYPRDLASDRADPVWADTFSKDGREPSPVETLAVTTAYLDEVIPVITAATAALGLVAYDPQLGTVYLPGGRTLGTPPPPPRKGQSAQAQTAATPPEFLNKATALTCFVDKAGPMLGAHGFRWTKLPLGQVFLRTFPGGQQIVAPVTTTGREGTPGLSLLVIGNLFAVDEHVHRLRTPRNPKPTEVLSSELHGWLQARGDERAARLYRGEVGECAIPVGTVAQVDAAVEVLKAIVPDLLSEMTAFETLEGSWNAAVEAAQGRRTAHFTESLDAKVIAGKLLGAAGLEEVVERDAARSSADLERRRQARPDPHTHAMLARSEETAALRRQTLLAFVQRDLRLD